MPVTYRLYPNFRVKNQPGFTLLELIVTITIAGILFGIAVPSFNTAIRNNRLTTLNNDFITALNIARSEAVKRGQIVTVCRSATGTACAADTTYNWAPGWIVFTNQNNNTAIDGGDAILRVQGAAQVQITMIGDNVGGAVATDVRNRINYGSSGMTVANNGGAGVTGNIAICDNRRTEAVGKIIAINPGGRPNTTDRVVCGP